MLYDVYECDDFQIGEGSGILYIYGGKLVGKVSNLEGFMKISKIRNDIAKTNGKTINAIICPGLHSDNHIYDSISFEEA